MLDVIWDFLGKNAAEIIALCALFFTTWQFSVQRRHNKVSVLPHLNCYVHRSEIHNKGKVIVRAINNGLGPAFIKSFTLTLDGDPINFDLLQDARLLFNQVLGNVRTFKYNITLLDNDGSLQINDSVDIIVLDIDISSDDSIDKVVHDLKRIDASLIYRSIYGDEFKLQSLYKYS